MTLSVGTRPLAAGATAVPFTSRFRPRFKATWQNLTRDRGVDTAIAARLEFERGERVLAADRDSGGEYAVVATDRALYHRFGHGGATADGWTRLGWEEIARVGWDADAGRLVVTGADPDRTVPAGTVPASPVPAGTVPPRVVVPLRQRGTIPELVMERVTHTRLGRWQLRDGSARRAVIEARRRPGTGELVWSVTYRGNGPAEPDVRARAERAVARLRAEFGALPQPGTGPSAVAIGRPRSGGTGAEAE